MQLKNLKKFKDSGFKSILIQHISKIKANTVQDVAKKEEDAANEDEDDKAEATIEVDKPELVGSKRLRKSTDLYSPKEKHENVEVKGTFLIKKKKKKKNSNTSSKIKPSHVDYDEEELAFLFPNDGVASACFIETISDQYSASLAQLELDIVTAVDPAKMIREHKEKWYDYLTAPRRRCDGVPITNTIGLLVKTSSYKREGYKLNDGV